MSWIWGLLIAAAVVYIFLRATVSEPHSVEITRRDIGVPDLPHDLHGLEIVHLTDLHLTGYGPYEQEVVRLVRALDAPVVAWTGDYLQRGGTPGTLIPMLMEIGRNRNVYGVLGNNDHGARVHTQSLARDLVRSGVHILVNNSEILTVGKARLRIVGVDDPHSGRADLPRALGQQDAGTQGQQDAGDQGQQGARDPRGAASLPATVDDRIPTLLLAHSPEILPAAVEAGIDVVLAGHTHGGQICLPLFGAVVTNTRMGRRYASGLFRKGPTQMYISRGLGTTMLRARLFCRPEIAVLRLVRAAGENAV